MNESNGLKLIKKGQDPRQPEVTFAGGQEQAVSAESLLGWLQNNKVKSEEIEAAIEALKIYLSIPEKVKSSEDLMDLLEVKNSFLDRVAFPEDREVFRLSLTKRPDGKELLKYLSPEYVERLSQLKNADEAVALVQEKLANTGFELVTEVQKKEISEEDRRILRIDFNGYIEQPDRGKFSDAYRSFTLKQRAKEDDEDREPLDIQYDFTGTVWDKMRKSPRMSHLEESVVKALQYNGVTQEVLNQMSIHDFEDAYYKYAQSMGKAGLEKANFGVSAKALAVKGFINNHEEEFVQQLKSLSCPQEEIDRAVGIMKKDGRVPVIKISKDWVMTAEVHHDIAIKDAGQLKNMFDVNRPDNHALMFEVKEAKRTNFNNKALAAEYQSIKAETAINLGQDYADLKELTYNPKAKKDFIKRLAKDKMEGLYLGLKSFGVSKEDAQNAILGMHNTGNSGSITAGDLQIGISLKNFRGSQVLEFGVYAPESEQADVHHNIAHGMDSHPQAMVINPENLPTSLMSKITDNSSPFHQDPTDAFSVELKDDSPQDIESRKHVITRIRIKAQNTGTVTQEDWRKPTAYIGGVGNPIYRTNGDDAWAKQANAPENLAKEVKLQNEKFNRSY